MCGEKEDMKKAGLNPIGSPPRVRGKVACQGPRVARYRITPAYAGKRGHRRFGPGTIRDHPRVCGEKSKTQPDCLYPVGSPPRMRGKVKVQVANKLVAGITPAYAGKRAGRCPDGCTPWDHPRVCGEKCSSVRSASHRRGSPPRMRGKDLPFTCDCESTGITPACAGKRVSTT